MLLLGLVACQTTLVGDVRTAGGGPVAGATLVSPGCNAVTDAAGHFRVACDAGPRTFALTHPDHLDGAWPVDVSGYGEQSVGAFELAPIPEAPGLFLKKGNELPLLPAGPFTRTVTTDEQRWCMDASAGSPVSVPAGNVRLLDNHAVDWRVYRLDAGGCAYRMKPSAGGHWTWVADRVEVGPTTERGPGRAWVDLALPPGDYALVEWYEGFFVHGEGDRWNAVWLRAAAESPGATASDTLKPGETKAAQAP